MKSFDVTVKYSVEANDHAEATSTVVDAAKDFNAKKLAERRPQRIAVESVKVDNGRE